MIHLTTSPLVHPLFDLAAWGAGAASGWGLYHWRLKAAAAGVSARVGPGYFLALAAGAVAGAWLAGSLNTLREAAPALSHSIAGALAGAIVAVEIYKSVYGVKGSTGGMFVGSLTVGIIVGRFGCLFSGLADRTYGVPTTLPWAVDLGDGIGRHPVQIYESAAMAAFLIVYLIGLKQRAAWAMRRGFYVAVAWYGAQRFVWEFLKPYPRLIGPFNLFHLISLGLLVYGCVWFLGDRRADADAQDGALSLPRPDHLPV